MLIDAEILKAGEAYEGLCRFRGAVIGKKPCETCPGRARYKVFFCPFNAAGVTIHDCHACHVRKLDLPEPPPSAPLVAIAIHPGYRERHCTFFLKPFMAAGWRVAPVVMDRGQPLCNLPGQFARIGLPDALIQWEEHGTARCTRAWREVVAWAYAHGVVPLSLDFGYISHYEQFMLDFYERDGSSSIEREWARISDAAPDWDGVVSFIPQDRRRRVLRGYEAARSQPPLIEGRYVALWLQQYASLCRFAQHHNNDVVARAAAELRKQGLKLAVKTAPSTPEHDALAKWPEDVVVFRHEDVAGDTNQRLAVHAEYCLVVSSSITNEFVLAELPVVALGRSWFSGKGIFFEPARWKDLPARAPAANQPARNKYLNWWLGRQFKSDDAGPHLERIVRSGREIMTADSVPGTAVTCVYAPDRQTENVAWSSLECTAEALPDWKRIAAIDAASPAFALGLPRLKFTAIATDEGAPPRMSKLLAAAVAQARGEFVFTIEHDVFIDRDQAEAAARILRSLPNRVAALYMQSRTPEGEPNYPWANDWPRAQPWPGGEHFRVPAWPTLSATLWRTAGLQQIDWERVPALEFVDGAIGDQLRRVGSICLMTDLVHAFHLPHTGRRCTRGEARTLAVGCRNIWARRGIRFGWNGQADLDVRGTVLGALPFDAGTFREIYVGAELKDLTRKQREIFVIEARRCLRPGGRFDVSHDTKHMLRLIEKGGFKVHKTSATRIVAEAVKE